MSVLENLLLAKKRTGRRKRESTDGDTQRKSKKRKREPSVRSEGSEKKSPGNKNTKGEEESEEQSEEVTEGFGDDQTQRGNRLLPQKPHIGLLLVSFKRSSGSGRSA